jgi:hypothetical protein
VTRPPGVPWPWAGGEQRGHTDAARMRGAGDSGRMLGSVVRSWGQSGGLGDSDARKGGLRLVRGEVRPVSAASGADVAPRSQGRKGQQSPVPQGWAGQSRPRGDSRTADSFRGSSAALVAYSAQTPTAGHLTLMAFHLGRPVCSSWSVGSPVAQALLEQPSCLTLPSSSYYRLQPLHPHNT